MPILTSEKTGIIQLVIDEGFEVNQITGMNLWRHYTEAKKIRIRELIRPSFSAELMTFHLDTDDVIIFSYSPMPYTLIFVFGNSITLYLPPFIKMEMHDRSSNLFYCPGNSHRIQFRKERDYLLIFIHYSEDFVATNLEESAQDIRIKWEHQSPIFYYPRSRIVTWNMMEFLSMLMLSSKAVWNEDILMGELARTILLDFLHEPNISYQPAKLRSEDLISFYQERDRLVKEAILSSSLSKILAKSEIRNISLFRKRLTQLYDLNIREFITETKMAKAITLLKDPTLSIKEIASQTGFSNSLYFSRVFSHFFGTPPKTYHSKGE